MTALTVSPKTLRDELKPIIAAIRKQTTPTNRWRIPLIGAVRIQYRDGLNAAYLFDEEHHLGPFPDESASLDILLDTDNAYALATILDTKKVATLTIEHEPVPTCGPVPATRQMLTVTQPSACPGRTDVMRFKLLEP